jgi:hypothetical protein
LTSTVDGGTSVLEAADADGVVAKAVDELEEETAFRGRGITAAVSSP